jgi:hypothetical protein
MQNIFQASAYGHIEAVRLLIENGANLNEKDSYGDTPLHCATCKGQIDIVRLLIERGACVNAKNLHGIRPLHYATAEGYIDIARFLIQNGASIIKKDYYDRTPLHYATYYKHAKTVALFHDLELRKRNVIKRMSLQVLSSSEEPRQDMQKLRSRQISDIIRAVATSEDFVCARSVNKTWRSLADTTLESREPEFFAYKV